MRRWRCFEAARALVPVRAQRQLTVDDKAGHLEGRSAFCMRGVLLSSGNEVCDGMPALRPWAMTLTATVSVVTALRDAFFAAVLLAFDVSHAHVRLPAAVRMRAIAV